MMCDVRVCVLVGMQVYFSVSVFLQPGVCLYKYVCVSVSV